MISLYSVSISSNRVLPYGFIEMELSRFEDWLAFSSSNYLVFTSKLPADLVNAIRAHMYPDDFILVTKVTPPDLWGWVPDNVLQWIAKDRSLFLPKP